MGKDVQVLKLEIQNHTVTVLYCTDRGPTLQQIYWTKVQWSDHLLYFLYIILKNQIWSKIKSFVDFKLRVVIIHLYIISSWPFDQQPNSN